MDEGGGGGSITQPDLFLPSSRPHSLYNKHRSSSSSFFACLPFLYTWLSISFFYLNSSHARTPTKKNLWVPLFFLFRSSFSFLFLFGVSVYKSVCWLLPQTQIHLVKTLRCQFVVMFFCIVPYSSSLPTTTHWLFPLSSFLLQMLCVTQTKLRSITIIRDVYWKRWGGFRNLKNE